MIESFILGCVCLGQLFVGVNVLGDIVVRHSSTANGKIRDIKQIAKTIKIVRRNVEKNDRVTLFLNIKTLDFWAEKNNDTPYEDEVRIDYSFYVMNGEEITEEQIELIRDISIKKYTKHRELVEMHRTEKCKCGMFYR